ncbi:MAG: pseudouridine synthase [Candidatus Woesearchaeota archaeon]
MAKLRLHQFLSKTGAFDSKQQIVDAVRNKEISINDKIVTDLHYQFKPSKEKVFWKNKELKKLSESIYILINKPEDYLSSRLTEKDIQHKNKSIFKIIDEDQKLNDSEKKSLFSVGRLDKNSSGLLIITNDGELGSKITEPKNNIKKTYEVKLAKPISIEEIAKIEQGVMIDLEENGKIIQHKTKPCKITKLEQNKILIIITEGKKREVRRIFEKMNNQVYKLKRVAIGDIMLGEMKPGEYKRTTKEDILSNL